MDDVDVNESEVLQELLGKPDLWPLQPEGWDDDTFCDLIEVFHDLVARPRERWWHNYSSCGWHYQAFAVAPGRALHRCRINKIFAASDIPFDSLNTAKTPAARASRPGRPGSAG